MTRLTIDREEYKKKLEIRAKRSLLPRPRA